MPKKGKETSSDYYAAGRAKIVEAMKNAQASGTSLNKNQILKLVRAHNQSLKGMDLKRSKNFGNAKMSHKIFFDGTNDGSSTDNLFRKYGGRSEKEMIADKKAANKETEKVVAPATLQENRDRFYNKNSKGALGFDDTPEPSGDRLNVIRKSVKDGSMTDLAAKVKEKYGTEYHKINDPQDIQMAGDAMLGPDGEILPMSSASGQYSGSAMPKKAPRGFKMPGYGNKK